MQKILSYESVAFACLKLKQDGEKITGRSVVAVTGGSFGSVLKYIKQWREKEHSDVGVLEEIPEPLHQAIVQSLWQTAQDTTELVKEQISRANVSEAEAVEALCREEDKLKALQVELNTSNNNHQQAEHKLETEMALLSEKLMSAENKNIEFLREIKEKTERINTVLIESAELRQAVKYTEEAVLKFESKVIELERKMGELTQANFTLEKQKAIYLQSKGAM